MCPRKASSFGIIILNISVVLLLCFYGKQWLSQYGKERHYSEKNSRIMRTWQRHEGKINAVKQDNSHVHTRQGSVDFRAQAQNVDKLLMMPSNTKLEGADCSEILRRNSHEIRNAGDVTTANSISDKGFLNLTLDCDQFKRRGYMTVPVNNEEEQFPIAYIIQMYKDIVQVERLLMAIYRPQNVYCINVDMSADVTVHLGMTAIATCFDNVHITNIDVAWASFSQVEADLACMHVLYSKNIAWRYVLTVAGQMFPLKTNLDIVRILKALNGSNAVEASIKKVNTVHWDFLQPPPLNVTMVKGGCSFAVTRSFVQYVLYDESAIQFRKWARDISYPDEHFFQSLSHSPQLGVPGAYTGLAENGAEGYEDIMRYVVYAGSDKMCNGEYVRAACVFGVADLADMAKDHHLFVNKLYYDYQPLALQCLEERHYNWTRQDILGSGEDRINLDFYQSLPNARRHLPSGLEH